jgi:hypothetical protein
VADFTIEDAREFVASEMAAHDDSMAREALVKAYADLHNNPAFQLVMADLVRTFHDRESAAHEEEVATIDHPFRAYYIDGERRAILDLREAVKRAARGEL